VSPDHGTHIEFTRRLGEAETRLRATAQDRDQTKRELNQAQKDLQAKSALEAIVKEKEDLIQVAGYQNHIRWGVSFI
jgi:arsenate reductase-like glutaredoxin family protein